MNVRARWRSFATIGVMVAGAAAAAIASAPASQASTPGVTGYEVVAGGVVDMNGPASTVTSVACPTGKSAVGGGVSSHSPLEILESSYPQNTTTWSVTVTLPVDVGYTEHFTPYAVCVNSSSVAGLVDVFSSNFTIATQNEALASVECPSGDVALDGGVYGQDRADRMVESIRGDSEPRLWLGGEYNTSTTDSSVMVVYAVCVPATDVTDYAAQFTHFGDTGSNLDQPVTNSTALSGTAGTPYCPAGDAAVGAGAAVHDSDHAFLSSLIPGPQGDPHYWLATSTDVNPTVGSPGTQETVDICVQAALPIATTTSLAINPVQPALNQLVTLTATVTAASGTDVPAGMVEFYDNGALIGSGALNNGVATMTYRFAAGSHSLVAKYLGDSVDSPGFLPSQSAAVTFAITCTTTITGTHGAIIASSGLTCVTNAHINGGVTVANGAQLDVEHSTIAGSVTMSASGASRICGTTLSSLAVAAASGYVMIGDPALGCSGNTINGGVTISGNKGGGSLINNKISGSTTVSGNTPAWTVSGNHT